MIRRGFIRGLLLLLPLVLAVGAAFAQGYGRAGAPAMGVVPGVQDLTDQQQKQISAIRSDTMRKVQKVRFDASLASDEKAERISEIQRDGHAKVLAELSPQQRQLFQNWWDNRPAQPGMGLRSGMRPGAMHHGDVKGRRSGMGPAKGPRMGPRRLGASGEVPGVNVTAEQREQIAAIRADTQDEVQAIRADSALTAQEKAARIADLRRESHQEVLALLTPDQRQDFDAWWASREATGAPAGMGPQRRGGR